MKSSQSTAERRYRLITLLESQGSLSVDQLAEELHVSSMTIRRDVDYLVEEGIVSHPDQGKVSIKRDALFELNIEQKKYVHITQKRAIGAFCADLVEDNEMAFIDGGTTTMEVARNVAKRPNVTVMTNSLSVASVVAAVPDAHLSMCPGVYRRRSVDFLGVLATSFISNQDIDIAFLGIGGISPGFGLSVSNTPEWAFKRSLIRRAKRIICVADSSKFGVDWLCVLCPLSDIDLIVTDEGISDQMASACRKAGADIAIVDSSKYTG